MAAMAAPTLPDKIELPPQPPHDGNVVELSLGKLAASLTWLFNAVDMLMKGMAQINSCLEKQADLWKRLESLENKPPPEPVTIVQERPKTPPPPPPPPPKIEIPYVPTEEERAEEARRAVRPMLEKQVSELMEKHESNAGRIGTLEDIEAKRPDPWARMQTYMQGIGFLPYGEPEEKDPLVLLGQVLVLIRQDIAMCPKIKDLEDAEKKLNARINEVEAFAAADREARSQAAAAEAAKLREDLARVDDVVQGLVRKNLEDGDVAGGLRDLGIRVDMMEERRFPKLENRVRILEEAERPPPDDGSGARKKGFLESLAEVNLEEEVRRLRSIVECMEASMPYETRQTLQFMREGGKVNADATAAQAGTQGTVAAMPPSSTGASLGGGSQLQLTMAPASVAGADNGLDLVSFREETEQQLEKFRLRVDKQQSDLQKNLRNHEKKVEVLESKVMDVWKRLPKVLAVLEPLQAQLEMALNPPIQDVIDSTGGAAKPAGAATFLTEGGTGGGPDAATFFGGSAAKATAAAPAAPAGAATATTAPVVGAATATAAPVVGAATATTAPTTGTAATATAPAVGGAAPSPAATTVPTGGAAPTAVPTPLPTAGPTPLPTAAPTGAPGAVSSPVPAGGVKAPGAAQASPGLSQAKMLMGGFAPLPEGAAGTGEAGMPPTKGQEYSPMAQMGSLTGLIKMALQSTTNDIQFNLRKELYQCRTEFLGNLDGKANKSELLALSNRLDAWTQKSRARDRVREPVARAAERSISPSVEADTTMRDTGSSVKNSQIDSSGSVKYQQVPLASVGSAAPGKATTAATSPTVVDKKKGGPTCHDKCKEPTCPRSLAMSQSLSRLPALKTVQ